MEKRKIYVKTSNSKMKKNYCQNVYDPGRGTFSISGKNSSFDRIEKMKFWTKSPDYNSTLSRRAIHIFVWSYAW